MKSLAAFCAVISCIAPAHAQRNLSGTPEIKLALDKLNVLGSVLMIAAHPDDENTAILAYCARGRKVRTGYLSATRGEGGQNLIGSEQGDLLGVIRTQELLAARRIDGAEQFFTRAIDFGFTKTPEETLRKWGRDKILSDMVWVIREFQPDVILLRFSGTPRDGHGQHQSSAILGKEAFTAAADPARFPEQLKLTQIWQAKRLMWNVFSFNAEQEKAAAEMGGRIEVDPGIFDPILGKSYAEIAGLSRSEHRSQGMGAAERRGPSRNFLVTVAGDKAAKDLFDGVDITWNRVPGGSGIAPILAKAAADFVPEHPERTIPLLAQARPAIADLAATKNAWGARKLAEIDEAIALCAGLWVEAQAERAAVSPGSAFTINVSAINRSPVPVNEVHAKIQGIGTEQSLTLAKSLSYNTPVTQTANITVPADAAYSQPFWLRRPHVGDAYDIDDQQLIGRADRLPVSQAVFEISVGATRISLTRPVQYRYVDRVLGEMTRPLAVVPALAVNLPEPVVVFTHPGTRQIAVQLTANARQVSGEVHLTADPGWKVEPASKRFQIAQSGEQQELTFAIARDSVGPEKNGPAHFRVSASVGGKEIAAGMQVIAYPHIPPQAIFRPSDGLLRMAPLTVLSKRVGYVMGAGDEVPDSLKQMGCEVRLLSEEDLSRGDLSGYDAIVTGVRAYNVRADLRANQHRLLDYVRNGGRMIVQYNVAENPRFTGRTSSDLEHVGPYPFKIGSDRVTVEEAPVAFPHPDSRLLQAPNHITPADFEGWIQERGLYFASEWDSHYETVLESHDPTEKALPGGMLFTRYGKGSYIFTAYAWFRQLPAGVPGAYRLFANLLSN
ncbi:MAG: PIG-L family deacetylase [Acidobacteriota bacterium]|nr:PIG-L family deacetylase [Acidobacteriota bacterium]